MRTVMRIPGWNDWGTVSETIRERVPTRLLCESVGLALDSHGNTICPFHGDRRTPSLKVYDDPARGWHCFGCGAGGTVIDLCMRWYGVTFRQAVVRLDMMFGLGLPLTGRPAPGDALRMAQEARERAMERERAQQQRADAETAYWAAYGRMQALTRTIDDYRPRRPRDEIDVRYAVALWLLPEVQDGYERAQDARINLREKWGGKVGREQPAGAAS